MSSTTLRRAAIMERVSRAKRSNSSFIVVAVSRCKDEHPPLLFKHHRPSRAHSPVREAVIRLSDRSMVAAEVCATPFFDPENLRQKETA
jgi:hypothetical protein